ncbi:MAG: pilus assembly protein PilP [Burkholderiaceae bacterium]|nr:pilus assembly protein PilP [Burkholderiaceae bacterium]
MNLFRIGRCLLVVLLPASLAACGDGGMQEVKDWMKQVKAQTKVTVPKLAEPKKFIPYAYPDQNAVDPFNLTKLTIALAKAQSDSHSALRPDMNRRREPLESYPLDAITMVGSLRKGNATYAILQADRTIFEAKAGNYVGQNFGLITTVTDNQVAITERVQDSSDEWVERKTTLELQETTK